MGGSLAPVDPEDAQDTLLNAEQAASMQVLNSAGFAKGETGESGLSEKVQKQGRQRKVCLRLLGGLFGLAALAGAAVGLSLWLQNREAFMGSARENHSSPSAGSAPSITKRNVILMISDGFGPASETLARDYVQALGNGGPETMLALDSILVGSSRTQSSSSYVTDSAAGATAFSCAMKSYNGAIAVDPRQNPCGTVLESAKALGYKTGLVATSRITHATPASFAAHVPFRDMEDIIAQHEIGNYSLGRRVDLMFGGGLCFFQPMSVAGSCRKDDLDLLKWAKEHGWHVGTDRSTFDRISESVTLPVMNLFSKDHMAYNLDREAEKEPSLMEMATKALDILSAATKDSDKGFFLMIEGSRIDMAAHSNDPAAHIHEILAYQETVAAVKKFVEANPNTVVVSVSDHETGGLSVAHQLGVEYPEYKWRPEALFPVKHSAEYMSRALLSQTGAKVEFIKDTILKQWLNISDFSQLDVDILVKANVSTDIEYYLGHMISDRALLGWSTHGHSAVDVNLYAYGDGSQDLRGNHDNTEIGKFIERRLGLDLKAVTDKLQTSFTLQFPRDILLTRQDSHSRYHN